MKNLLPLLLGLLFALPAATQTQKGYVKTRGRLGVNGTLIPGERLADVFVKIRGRQGVRSNAKGNFTIPVDRNFYVERIEKAGYTVADRDLLSRRYDYSAGNPLIVVLEKPDTRQQDKLAAEHKIRRTLRRQLDRREEELDRLREEQRITQTRYDSLLRALYEDQNKNEKLIADMAERYASTDFDRQDELNRRISACILNGELSRADSLLRTKGDIHERAAALQHHRSLNDAEAEELVLHKNNLNKSRRLEAHKLEELAIDCYNRHKFFLLEHRNDSAAYYLRLRAKLDTSNVVWALEAGDFMCEYLADYSGALVCYKQALEDAQIRYGQEHPSVATFHLHIGNAYMKSEHYNEALARYTSALSICKSIYGTNHPDVATCYNNTAVIYNRQGRYDEALSQYYSALGILKSAYGELHPDVGKSYCNIGVVYDNQGCYEKALQQYITALEILKSAYGEHHPDVATCYLNIGNTYNRLGRHDEALSQFSTALTIFLSAYGEHHPDVATCYAGKGVAYESKGRYDEALLQYVSALTIYKSVYGEHHPNIANCYSRTAFLYGCQGRYDEALSHYASALEIYKSLYGSQHLTTAECHYNMGLVYNGMGRNDEALLQFVTTLNILESIYGEHHTPVANCYYNIGALYACMGRYSDALQNAGKALIIYKESLSENAPDIVKAQELIEQIKSNMPQEK